MGRDPLDINQNYFDKESKSMYYVLGAFYGNGLIITASYTKKNGVNQVYRGLKYCTNCRALMDIITAELNLSVSVTEDKRPGHNSFWFQQFGVDNLCERLEALGLGLPKDERTFPEIDEKYLSHFVRGYFDAKGTVQDNEGRTSIIIWGYPSFLIGLNLALWRYAGIIQEGKTNRKLRFNYPDSIKLYNFMYQDWECISKNGIYLPSNKDAFNLNYRPRDRCDELRKQRMGRIKRAKELLLESKPVGDVATELGYKNPESLSASFRKATGMSPRDYIKSHAK